MTPVETLRKAARLMRERAAAAVPGPWWTHPDASPEEAEVWYGDRDHLIDYDRERHDKSQVPWGILATLDYDRTRHDATHIASWHPAVALAVADWLDGTASEIQFWGVSEQATLAQKSLAVARIYLEEA